MQISITAPKPEAEYTFSEAKCLQLESGTLLECISGDLFMVIGDYRCLAPRGVRNMLIMFAPSGVSYNDNWADSGYRRFKVRGKYDIAFSCPTVT
jgi:hypothetical protein